MKIVFVSNYFNHHQKPFCDEMYQKLGADFTFISTTEMREERKKLGYSMEWLPAYVLLSHESEQKYSDALKLINEADVVIAGSAPNRMLTERIRRGKLLFRYSERPFKKKISFLKRLYHAFHLRQMDLFKKNIYMLCASAYAAGDFAKIGMYKNRTYKWGYFPLVKEYDMDDLFSRKKTNTLLWCGRFIDWKHPDDAVMVARKLKESGYDFHLNMVGTGVMEAELKQLVADYALDDVVHFLGSMPPEQVRARMEEAGIFLFTSDRQEGWGAVLNESMNSGCAVVASQAIGSVPFLICDGENGFVYPSGNVDVLFEKVAYLLDYSDEQIRVGQAAYQTITGVWNAIAACNRSLQLFEKLMEGEEHIPLFENGLCSIAEVIEEDSSANSVIDK